MSDDRFSEEQKAIDEAAKANPPPVPTLCGAQRERPDEAADVCELGHGHVGNHRVTLPDKTKRYWWDAVDPRVIEREAERWAPPEAKKKQEPAPVPVRPGEAMSREAKPVSNESLGTALPAEMKRVRDDVLPAYLECGRAGAFVVSEIRRDLDAATKALAEGDVVAMMRCYRALSTYDT